MKVLGKRVLIELIFEENNIIDIQGNKEYTNQAKIIAVGDESLEVLEDGQKIIFTDIEGEKVIDTEPTQMIIPDSSIYAIL